jgi:hypothetical protein
VVSLETILAVPKKIVNASKARHYAGWAHH